MPVSDTVLVLGALITFIFVALGSWALHSQLHNLASRALLASVMAFPLWIPVSYAISHFLLKNFSGNDVRALNILSNLITVNVSALSLFAVASAVSFWFAVRSLGQRPNNSFKPKPLRGSA
jgi:hypothetical protein